MIPGLQGWVGNSMAVGSTGIQPGPYRVPQGQLPLAHAAEAGGEDVPVRQENGSHGPRSFVGLLLLLEQRSRSGLAGNRNPLGSGGSSMQEEIQGATSNSPSL